MPKEQSKTEDLYLGFWKNKKDFFNYLRGRMRSIWSRYPPKIAFKTPLLVDKFEGCGVDNPRVKKVGQCNCCKNWFASSHLEVDHIVAAGGFNSDWQSFAIWVQRLLLVEGNLQLLCKGCHSVKSLADRMNISFEEAQERKIAYAFEKLKADVQYATLLGYGIQPEKSKAGRVKQYLEVKKNEQQL